MQIIRVIGWRELPKNYTGIAVYSDGTKSYYINNKLHRVDGPVIEYPDVYTEYWYNDKPTSKKAIELLNNTIKLRSKCKQ